MLCGLCRTVRELVLLYLPIYSLIYSKYIRSCIRSYIPGYPQKTGLGFNAITSFSKIEACLAPLWHAVGIWGLQVGYVIACTSLCEQPLLSEIRHSKWTAVLLFIQKEWHARHHVCACIQARSDILINLAQRCVAGLETSGWTVSSTCKHIVWFKKLKIRVGISRVTLDLLSETTKMFAVVLSS